MVDSPSQNHMRRQPKSKSLCKKAQIKIKLVDSPSQKKTTLQDRNNRKTFTEEIIENQASYESKTKNGSQLTTLFISPPICGRKLPRGVMAASSLDYCEVTNTAWVM